MLYSAVSWHSFLVSWNALPVLLVYDSEVPDGKSEINVFVCLFVSSHVYLFYSFIHIYLSTWGFLQILLSGTFRQLSQSAESSGMIDSSWEQPLGIKGGEAIPMLTSVTCLYKIIGFWRTDAVVQYSHWQRFSNQFIRGICVGWMQDAVRSTPVIRVCLRWWMWLGLWWKGRCQWMPQVIAALKMLLLLLFDDG